MSPDDDPRFLGIFVLKGERRLGPFTLDNLLDGLESGDFSENDVCLREGATEMERLRDLLDWDREESRDEDEFDEADPEEDDFEDEEGFDDEDEFDDEEKFDDEEFEVFGESGAAPGDAGAAGPQLRPGQARPDRILYSGHPSVLNHPLALLALVGGVVGGVWLLRLDSLYLLVGIALATAGLVRLSWIRFSNDYRVRTRRIEVITGFLVRSSREVRIADIRSVNVTCRGLRGALGIGTVDFLTSGDHPEVSFQRIWAARRIKALVRRLQDAA